MKKAKKILSVICTLGLVACSALAFTACGDNGGDDGTSHVHTYNKQVAEDKYKKSDATCTKKAEYYTSCECGEMGQETFEYGETAPHVFKFYVYDDNATCTENGTETARCENCFEASDT
ncbi:MAG: hypothetical protein K2N23_01590, partial [Clostridia bacterium]|nr:hypothetical protein [Clostridia bacterium]